MSSRPLTLRGGGYYEDPAKCRHERTSSTLKPEGVLESRCDDCGLLVLSAYVPPDERGFIRAKIEEAAARGSRR